MIRPAAIRRFELLWWGSFLVWLLAIGLAWPLTQYNIHRTLPDAAVVVAYVQPATVVLVLLLTALLWWGVARRASGAARLLALIVAVLAGLRVLNVLAGQVSAGFPAPVTTALFTLAAALDIAAVAQLFRGDARGWFAPLDDGIDDEVID